MHLPHEVTVDDRVGDRRTSEQRRNLPPHRRLADPGPPSDEEYFRVMHGGSLAAPSVSRDRISKCPAEAGGRAAPVLTRELLRPGRADVRGADVRGAGVCGILRLRAAGRRK
ncbi:hypothetical protein GCM10009680_64780 [Streptomyces yatensis]|uniref:Uncharacterized protein n=1 Tax=Streptomyces yatensis TaxID=155177 RepID=A0ABN2IYX0_9ACTN